MVLVIQALGPLEYVRLLLSQIHQWAGRHVQENYLCITAGFAVDSSSMRIYITIIWVRCSVDYAILIYTGIGG